MEETSSSERPVLPAPPYHAEFCTEGDIELVTLGITSLRFRIPSSVLRRSSGFFRAMFADAQPNVLGNASPEQRQVVAVDEDERTTEILLKISSALPFPLMQLTVADVERVAHAADKYDMPAALNTIQVMMHTPVMRAQPLRRYALAARYGWEDSYAEAMVDTFDLDIDFASLPPMDMLHLARLLRLRQLRVATFAAILDDGTIFNSGNRGTCVVGHALPRPTPWETLKAFLVLEMTRRPSGATVLAANQAALELARNATCATCSNNVRLYGWPATEENIIRAIQRLPMKLD